MYWMNTVPPKLIDQWTAYLMVKNEPSKATAGHQQPEQVRDILAGRFG